MIRLPSSLQMSNSKFQIYRCTCGDFKRGDMMKKHVAAENKKEGADFTHKTTWKRLICAKCEESAQFGDQAFYNRHSKCMNGEEFAKTNTKAFRKLARRVYSESQDDTKRWPRRSRSRRLFQ